MHSRAPKELSDVVAKLLSIISESPRSCDKAHTRQGGDPKQPAQLHQGQVVPALSNSLLQWSDGTGGQKGSN